ncbi:MAG: hypothetical protein R3C56_24820 [Pirellulaceae bacterium]
MLAPSFADIFFSNCFKNGVLPIKLSEAADRRFVRARRPARPLSHDRRSRDLHAHR